MSKAKSPVVITFSGSDEPHISLRDAAIDPLCWIIDGLSYRLVVAKNGRPKKNSQPYVTLTAAARWHDLEAKHARAKEKAEHEACAAALREMQRKFAAGETVDA